VAIDKMCTQTSGSLLHEMCTQTSGSLLRRLQRGDKMALPHVRPMSVLGARCAELRMPDVAPTVSPGHGRAGGNLIASPTEKLDAENEQKTLEANGWR